jgi:homoserine dehydrogenase
MSMDLAIVGVGAVGRSVAELAGEYGHSVTAIADSSGAAIDPDGLDIDAALEHKDSDGSVGSGAVEDVLSAEYDVLVEASPTTLDDAEPGFSNSRAALERDRHVVLANKGPVAERYGDVRALERESAGSVLFEATVGGAIPVLSTVAEGLDYRNVLAEAQDLGVAEADPSFDVEGTDAALKCVILANVLYGGGYELDDAAVDGIRDVPGSALELAAEDGRTVRLIGEVADGAVRVGPRLVPEHDPLAVTGTRNIVRLETRHAGVLDISGRGAGGPETATAVLADVGRLE